VTTWIETAFGDPCRECGFDWSVRFDDAVAIVRSAPDAFDGSLAGATGLERSPDLAWSVTSYVCHVTDNLRIWAERLMGAVQGGSTQVTGYDDNLLAEARRYDAIPLPGALWSLRQSVGDWLQAVAESDLQGTVLVHPDRGPLRLSDVVRSNSHDASHHQWDIRRILDAQP
jgi:hypothetical protein